MTSKNALKSDGFSLWHLALRKCGKHAGSLVLPELEKDLLTWMETTASIRSIIIARLSHTDARTSQPVSISSMHLSHGLPRRERHQQYAAV